MRARNFECPKKLSEYLHGKRKAQPSHPADMGKEKEELEKVSYGQAVLVCVFRSIAMDSCIFFAPHATSILKAEKVGYSAASRCSKEIAISDCFRQFRAFCFLFAHCRPHEKGLPGQPDLHSVRILLYFREIRRSVSLVLIRELMGNRSRFLSGERIASVPIPADVSVTELVDSFFQAYNAARLREAANLFVQKMLGAEVTIGMSLAGALTPAGLGGSCIVPLIESGFVDWIVSTGANLYHDTHFALGHELHRGTPFVDDRRLRSEGVIRIYDVLFHYDVLLSTDAFYRQIISLPEFQREMSTAEFHHLIGEFVAERERLLGIKHKSVLSAAYECGVPVYTSSPGDSSIGMNVAETVLRGAKLRLNVAADVNETAAIVLYAKRRGGLRGGAPGRNLKPGRAAGGKSGVLIIGGGSPKNFMLQTEPQIQEVLGIKEKGHDYFLQVTDARPDTGGLSGATPSEAVSWGKVDPNRLPDTVVVYVDSTIVLPILTSYALAKHEPRKHKRLYDRRGEMMNLLESEFRKARRRKGPAVSV